MDTTDQLLQMTLKNGVSLQNQLAGLAASFNIIFAALLGFLIIGVYILTTDKGKKDIPLVQSIPVLSILMAVLMRIDGTKSAIFFGIFGILSIVRFRSELTDQKGITFILFSIIMGLLSGMGSFVLAGISFLIISLVIIIIRFSFTNGRYKAAVFIFSSDLELNIIVKEADAVFKSLKISNEFLTIIEKYNKLNELKKEVEYLVHARNITTLLNHFKLVREELTKKQINSQIQSKL